MWSSTSTAPFTRWSRQTCTTLWSLQPWLQILHDMLFTAEAQFTHNGITNIRNLHSLVQENPQQQTQGHFQLLFSVIGCVWLTHTATNSFTTAPLLADIQTQHFLSFDLYTTTLVASQRIYIKVKVTHWISLLLISKLSQLGLWWVYDLLIHHPGSLPAGSSYLTYYPYINPKYGGRKVVLKDNVHSNHTQISHISKIIFAQSPNTLVLMFWGQCKTCLHTCKV